MLTQIYFMVSLGHNELMASDSYNIQCSKLLPVRQPEADNFGGGPGTFKKLFSNFMFMIWDSRQQDWQLFWLGFEHCLNIDRLVWHYHSAHSRCGVSTANAFQFNIKYITVLH